jgi:hypothetical protein
MVSIREAESLEPSAQAVKSAAYRGRKWSACFKRKFNIGCRVNDRQTSCFLTAIVIGLISGVVAGVFWGVLMAIIIGPRFQTMIPGLFFGLSMAVFFTAFLALHLWPVRLEWSAVGDSAARDRVIAEAEKLRYASRVDENNYMSFRPKDWFRIKPRCSMLEVWLKPQSVVIDGPRGIVRPMMKRLSQNQ